MIPESQHPKTFAHQKISAFLISFSIHCMLATINLHYQLMLQATEVYYINTDSPLASKFGAAQPSISQIEP